MEDLARIIIEVAADLTDAVKADEGPDRTNNTEIEARWYFGLPQLIFRDIDGRKERKLVRIRMRLTAFLQGDFGTLFGHWVCDRDKFLQKDRKSQPDKKERRVQQGPKAPCATDCA